MAAQTAIFEAIMLAQQQRHAAQQQHWLRMEEGNRRNGARLLRILTTSARLELWKPFACLQKVF